jgi:hypothetical protein
MYLVRFSGIRLGPINKKCPILKARLLMEVKTVFLPELHKVL